MEKPKCEICILDPVCIKPCQDLIDHFSNIEDYKDDPLYTAKIYRNFAASPEIMYPKD